jgi:uncharacterized protein YwgA
MNQFERQAIVAELIKNMRDKGSWTGETHVQKCAYFLQTMLKVDLGFAFLLYRYGPYSFDLTAELETMQFCSAIEFETPIPPYGPRFMTGEGSKALLADYEYILGQHRNSIQFVANNISVKKVQELEQLATAWYFSQKLGPSASKTTIAREVNKVKPHISVAQAEKAYDDCLVLLSNWQQIQAAN